MTGTHHQYSKHNDEIHTISAIKSMYFSPKSHAYDF